MRWPVGGVLTIGASLLLAASAVGADAYRKLADAGIKAKLGGMEVTDGVHWAEQYMRDGTFKAFHMGKASKGKWHARNGELCLEGSASEFACREVWLFGNKIEFRLPGSGMTPIDGVLQKQQPRQ